MKKKIFFLGMSFVFIFVIGYITGSPELPFNDTLKTLYGNYIKMNDNKQYEEIDPFFYKTNVTSLINIENRNDILEKRQELIEFIWKSKSFPTQNTPTIEENISDERYRKLKNLEQIDKYTISMDYGVDSIAYLFLAKEKNGNLVIYHEGHGGDFIRGYETIDSLLQNNYSVIAFSMPLLGLNNQPEVEIPHLGRIILKNHNNFQFLDTSDFSSIKFFLHPVTVSLNYIEQAHKFDKYYMIGISGGAWVTMLYSAIDDRIQKRLSHHWHSTIILNNKCSRK